MKVSVRSTKWIGIITSTILIAVVAGSIIATPFTFATENAWNEAYGRNSSRNKQNNRNVNKESSSVKESNFVSKKTSSQKTLTIQPSQPQPTATVAVTTPAPKQVIAAPTLPPDTAPMVKKVAEEQTKITSIPVVYASNKLDTATARTFVMSGAVSAIVGGMIISFTYLPIVNRYRQVGSSVVG